MEGRSLRLRRVGRARVFGGPRPRHDDAQQRERAEPGKRGCHGVRRGHRRSEAQRERKRREQQSPPVSRVRTSRLRERQSVSASESASPTSVAGPTPRTGTRIQNSAKAASPRLADRNVRMIPGRSSSGRAGALQLVHAEVDLVTVVAQGRRGQRSDAGARVPPEDMNSAASESTTTSPGRRRWAATYTEGRRIMESPLDLQPPRTLRGVPRTMRLRPWLPPERRA